MVAVENKLLQPLPEIDWQEIGMQDLDMMKPIVKPEISLTFSPPVKTCLSWSLLIQSLLAERITVSLS